MLTPAQLREHEFKQAGRNAYKSEDVDAFFAQILIDYEKMFRENSELIKRVSLLAERVEEYKKDEDEIKDAVVSAQKAARVIVLEAEESVADSRAEAEAILAAAKGEAEIIISDAEKQAIADSELALSVARDRAEEVIAKAKEEAHGIIIAANNSASDTVGAANRTITSESLHYDMLRKEVSDFRASVLAQYKAHIEMISKLPELADEEASKMETQDGESVVETVDDSGDYTSEFAQDDSVIEFTDEPLSEYIEPESQDGEEVIKTELPGGFFGETATLEFIDEEETVDDGIVSADDFESEPDETSDEPVDVTEPADIPISRRFKIDLSQVGLDNSADASEDIPQSAPAETEVEAASIPVVESSEDSTPAVETPSEEDSSPADASSDDFGYEDDDDDEEFDIMTSSFFDSVERIPTEEDGADLGDVKKSKKRFGLFKKKK